MGNLCDYSAFCGFRGKKKCPSFSSRAILRKMPWIIPTFFQFTSQALKSRGLKIAVVFLHRQFRLEVWLSGVNRSSQKRWFPLLATKDCPFLRTENPERSDYILRTPLPEDWNLADGDGTVFALKQKALELIAWSGREMV